MIIGSRGSGEAKGLGAPVGQFVTDLADLAPGGSSLANGYPAASVAWEELAKEIVREPLRLSSAYTKSVGKGRDELNSAITTEVRVCPGTKLILAGYSQGAQVTGDVYTALAQSSAPAAAAALARIVGVVLFADPDYNHVEASDRVTPFQRSTQTKLRNDGILVHSPFTRPRSFPSTTVGRVLSYCVPQDPVCQGVGQLALHGMSAHGVYGERNAPQPLDAAQYLAALLRGPVVTPPTLLPVTGSSPVMIVADNSGSMADDDGSGRIKIDGEKSALLNFLSTIEPGTPIGLRTYPDQSSGVSCNSGALRFPIAPRDPAEMGAVIRTLQANGDTPTAEAMHAAADDLRSAGYARGTLVLISDGLSTCGNPCDEAKLIAKSGIAQTIMIGFNISDQGRKELECIANATNGTYVDANDSAGLAKAFGKLSRPTLSINLSYPPNVIAEVGNDPNGQVRIDATITNESQQEARNVVTRIRFDLNAPGVTRPVLELGNLDPGAARTVSWTFRPGVFLNGKAVDFTVLAHADNSLSDSEAAGVIAVSARAQASDAGPILRDRHKLAILGDSYSSGEGSDAYIAGTDTAENTCHRSNYTYLMQAFKQPASSLIACSGAVIQYVYTGQEASHVPSQLQQLQTLTDGRGVDAVAMTLGGNDAAFKTIAVSCVIMPVDCSKFIYPYAPWPGGKVESGSFVDKRLDGLDRALEKAYVNINSVLNTKSAVARRKSVAPILVLGYPLPIPLTGGACPPMNNLLSASEITFLGAFGTRLNGVVEGAVQAAHEQGVPVFFVPNSENAFQPDHTVCDRIPYARALDSLNHAGFDLSGFVKAVISGDASELVRWDVGLFTRSMQELVHPNKAGYEALTSAVIRWSASAAARSDADWLRTASPSPVNPPPSVVISTEELGQLVAGTVPTLQGGTSYPLSARGFAPSSPAEISIQSQDRVLAQLYAAAQGKLKTRIGIPPGIRPGGHTLTVAGVGPDGKLRTKTVRVHVKASGWPIEVRALAYGAAVTGAAAFLLWLVAGIGLRRSRRRR